MKPIISVWAAALVMLLLAAVPASSASQAQSMASSSALIPLQPTVVPGEVIVRLQGRRLERGHAVRRFRAPARASFRTSCSRGRRS